MSEKLTPKELPHEFLLKKYNLNIKDLSAHTQQLKSDLDKTTNLVLTRSKDGVVNLTPKTQQKISTYDRYICDGIWEYLEEQDEVSEEEAEKVEDKMDEKREEIEDKMEEAHEEAIEEQKEEVEEPKAEAEAEEPKAEGGEIEETQEEKPKDDKVQIGFWNWD
jgi:hypothetical protein